MDNAHERDVSEVGADPSLVCSTIRLCTSSQKLWNTTSMLADHQVWTQVLAYFGLDIKQGLSEQQAQQVHWFFMDLQCSVPRAWACAC